MEAKTLRLQNSTITYLDEGIGKPIVLLHGFCGSSRYWENIVPKLAENYRVIVPDLPGHGQSSTIEGNDSIEGFAVLVKNFPGSTDHSASNDVWPLIRRLYYARFCREIQ